MTDSPFTDAEQAALADLAALIIPASERHGVPGADDPAILAGIIADAAPHRGTLAGALAGVARLEGTPEARGKAFCEAWPDAAGLLQALIAQCYYRDPRVIRSLAMEARAPFPKGYEVPQGDWSLLDPVRAMGALHRPVG